MLNFDMTDNEPNFEEDDGTAAMMGKSAAWKKDAHAFEILGRYEARLSKRLRQTTEIAPLNPESASFGKPAPDYVMTAPQPTRIPLLLQLQ
jgi:hypothetical protein